MIKIRRIDNWSVREHAKGFQRKEGKFKALGQGEVEKGTEKNRTGRLSAVEGKVFQQRLSRRKNSKEKSHTIQAVQQPIINLCQQIKSIFSKLLQLYRSNETKLFSLISKHIHSECYIYARELLQLTRVMIHSKESFRVIGQLARCQQQRKVMHEVGKFRQYLEGLYQSKCLRHIEVAEEGIMQRERVIREGTTLERYKKLRRGLSAKLLKNEIDIVGEYKMINMETGRELDRVQSELFKKLRSAEHKVADVFVQVCQQKQKEQFGCGFKVIR